MIGRKKEIQILEQAFISKKPELVAILGRRRVGKTFLVRSFFEGKMDFELVGLKDGTREQQIRNFSYSLKDRQAERTKKELPIDWLAAFRQLSEYLESLGDLGRKKVVFIDEVPWIATRRSDFLTGFSYFWNSYASKNQIVVIICGSATAWMINKIMNDKGGLHNRVPIVFIFNLLHSPKQRPILKKGRFFLTVTKSFNFTWLWEEYRIILTKLRAEKVPFKTLMTFVLVSKVF